MSRALAVACMAFCVRTILPASRTAPDRNVAARVCSTDAAALDADALEAGRPELYPTWHAVGLEIPYRGDDDQDGSVAFTYRQGADGAWRDGPDLSRDAARRVWCGNIFPLAPGERVEVAVTFDDPDGATPEAVTAHVTTPGPLPTPTGGRQLWVSPEGNDGSAGTSEAPFRTIARASDGLRPGDVVHIIPGHYAEALELSSELAGTPDRPIVFLGEGSPRPVIDASVTVPKGSEWTDDGGDVYGRSAEGDARLVMQDGLRMFGYPSLAELRADALGVGRAFSYEAESGRLQVRTGTGRPPSSHRYQVSRSGHGFDLHGCSYVALRNLEIRHTAGAAVRIRGGDGNSLIDSALTDCAMGVLVKDPACDRTAIWHNTMRLHGQIDFTWEALMGEHWTFPRDGIYVWAGRGTSIVGNHIEGYQNLISLEPAPGPDRETASGRIDSNRDLDIMYNDLINASDDAIEADFGGVNMRIYANRVRNSNSGVSVAPCVRGPVHVLRNQFTFRTVMLKFGIGGGTSHGACYCDHNSGYGLTKGSGVGIYFNAKLPTTGKYFRNNVLLLPGEDAVLAVRAGNTLDGNCYGRADPSGLLKYQWGDRWLHGLEAFREASGMEAHGIQADPLFAATPGLAAYAVSDYTKNRASGPLSEGDAEMPDFRLQARSACLDRALRIRGINDDFLGAAPDIGAIEFGRDPPNTGPDDAPGYSGRRGK